MENKSKHTMNRFYLDSIFDPLKRGLRRGSKAKLPPSVILTLFLFYSGWPLFVAILALCVCVSVYKYRSTTSLCSFFNTHLSDLCVGFFFPLFYKRKYSNTTKHTHNGSFFRKMGGHVFFGLF